jgi:hypothetical protein
VSTNWGGSTRIGRVLTTDSDVSCTSLLPVASASASAQCAWCMVHGVVVNGVQCPLWSDKQIHLNLDHFNTNLSIVHPTIVHHRCQPPTTSTDSDQPLNLACSCLVQPPMGRATRGTLNKGRGTSPTFHLPPSSRRAASRLIPKHERMKRREKEKKEVEREPEQRGEGP